MLAASLSGPALARAEDLAPLHGTSPPYFTADVAVSVDSAAKAMVGITITVPYPEFSWNLLEGGRYGAGAGFVVALEPTGSPRVYGDAWEKRLLVESYALTARANHQLIVRRQIDVPPGRYRVRVRVRDLHSEQESIAEERLQVPDYARQVAGFADLGLGTRDSNGVFHLNPTRRFGLESSQLGVRAVVFDRHPGPWPRTRRLRWQILDASSAVVARGDTSVSLSRSAEPIVLLADNPGLFLGDYTFVVEMGEGRDRLRTQRVFEVEDSGPPRGREFDNILEALSYIADEREIAPMRGLTSDDARQRAWQAFWDRRDPTPETDRNEAEIEFFRRLRHAAKAFTGFGPGWRSDMGRIYIRYGPPDQVEQRAPTTQAPQLEIWSYTQPFHRFVFADREGFGRYTLLQSSGE